MKLQDIIDDRKVVSIDVLEEDKDLCNEVQTQLYYAGILTKRDVDSILGPVTRAAFNTFKKKNWLAKPNLLGPTTAKKLLAEIENHYILAKPDADYIYGRTLTYTQFEDLSECLEIFEINNVFRLLHFLSQTAHESGGLKWLKELASGEAYQGRVDLGNTQPGFGKKYKGAGALQLTGFYNYTFLKEYTQDPKVLDIGVDYVAENYPFTSAGVWWEKNYMNALCDTLNDNLQLTPRTEEAEAAVEVITLKVNGGTNGLEDRINYYYKALEVLT